MAKDNSFDIVSAMNLEEVKEWNVLSINRQM